MVLPTKWDELRSEFFADSVRVAAVDALEVEVGALAANLGAGSGFVTEEPLNRGLRVLAVDQSPAMLARMQEKVLPGRCISSISACTCCALHPARQSAGALCDPGFDEQGSVG
jgi:hypothetical protein